MKTRSQRRRKRIQVYLLVYFLCAVVASLLLALTGNWVKYFKLSRDNRSVVGRIVGREVQYTVEGQTYVTDMSAMIIYSTYSTAVHYYPPNPHIACVCDPQESLAAESWWVLSLSFGFSLFILFGYHHFRKDYWD